MSVAATTRWTTVVTIGAMIANISAYLLHLPASRWLGPQLYGEFASLLAVGLLVAVPALGIQSVIARERAVGASESSLRMLGYRTAVLLTLVCACATPLVGEITDSGIAAAAAALATGPILVLVSTEQGIAQGSARFVLLACLLAVVGMARVIPPVIMIALNQPMWLVFASSAGGAAVVWLVLWLGQHFYHASPPAGVAQVSVKDVIAASHVQLALIAFASLDIIVARSYLDELESGLYASGAIATKVALWLPAAIATVLYPQLADSSYQRATLIRGISALSIVGAFTTGLVALCAPLAPTVMGQSYSPIVNALWLFAFFGALLSVLQFVLMATIALARMQVAWIAWAGVACATAVVATYQPSYLGVLTIFTCSAATVTLVMMLLLFLITGHKNTPGK